MCLILRTWHCGMRVLEEHGGIAVYLALYPRPNRLHLKAAAVISLQIVADGKGNESNANRKQEENLATSYSEGHQL